MKTVVLSDAHVGSCETDYAGLHAFLVNLDCDRLILAGDFLDLWEADLAKIRADHADIIAAVNHLAARLPVVYVTGNHDEQLSAPPFNCPRQAFYELDSAGRKIMVIHGHEFDTAWWRLVSRPLCLANRWLWKTLGFSYTDVCNDGRAAVVNLRKKARATYGSRGYGAVIAGHVHAPEHCLPGVNGIEYANCGDWKKHDSYVVIEDGRIELQSITRA